MAVHKTVESFIAAIYGRLDAQEEALVIGLHAAAEDFATALRKYMPTLTGDAAGGVSVRLSGNLIEVVLTGARYVVESGWVENPRKAPHTGVPGHMHSSQELSRLKREGRQARYNAQAKVKPWVTACEDVGLRYIDLVSRGGIWHVVAEPTEKFMERLRHGV